jgi:hypothetical protein
MPAQDESSEKKLHFQEDKSSKKQATDAVVSLPDLELVTADLIAKFGLAGELPGDSAGAVEQVSSTTSHELVQMEPDSSWAEAIEGLAQLLAVAKSETEIDLATSTSSQAGFEQISFAEGDHAVNHAEITIKDHESIACTDSIVNVREFACAILSGRCQALARDNGTIVASGSASRIFADGHSHIISDGGQVWASDLATVDASGGELFVNRETVVNASGVTSIWASGSAMVFVEGLCTIHLSGDAVAFVDGKVMAKVSDRARIVQLGGELELGGNYDPRAVVAAGEPEALELLTILGERQQRRSQAADSISGLAEVWFDSDDPLGRLLLNVWHTVEYGKVEQTINKYGDVTTRFEAGPYKLIVYRQGQVPILVKRSQEAADLSGDDAGSITAEVSSGEPARMTIKTDGTRTVEFDLDESGCSLDLERRISVAEFPESVSRSVRTETKYSGREDGLKAEVTLRGYRGLERERTIVSSDGKRERVEKEGWDELGRRYVKITWPDGESGLSVQTLCEDGVVKTEFKMGPYRTITHTHGEEVVTSKRYEDAPNVCNDGICVLSTTDASGRTRELYSDGRWVTNLEGDPERRLKLINFPFNDCKRRISRVEYSPIADDLTETQALLVSESYLATAGGTIREREFQAANGILSERAWFDELGQVAFLEQAGVDDIGEFSRSEWTDQGFGLIIQTKYESGTVVTSLQRHPTIFHLICEPDAEPIVRAVDGSLRTALDSELSLVLRADLDERGVKRELLADGRTITGFAGGKGALRRTIFPPADAQGRVEQLEFKDRAVTRFDDSTEVTLFYPTSDSKIMRSIKYPSGDLQGRVSHADYFPGALRALKAESIYKVEALSIIEREFDRSDGVLKERSVYKNKNLLVAVERAGTDNSGSFTSREWHAGECGKVEQVFYEDGKVVTRFLGGGKPETLSSKFAEIVFTPGSAPLGQRRGGSEQEVVALLDDVLNEPFASVTNTDGSVIQYFLDGRTGEKES